MASVPGSSMSRWRASQWIRHYRGSLAEALKKLKKIKKPKLGSPAADELKAFFRAQIDNVERPEKPQKE